jgi:2-polyprenyl-3-methyl-5-hydroxy-6-metoxy-1,4-benzoquinol methylase
MDVGYWDDVAVEYEEAVLNPLEADLRGILRRRLRQFALPEGTACDYGCGPGRWLQGMAKKFKRVHAVDFSAACLAQAKRRCESISNITYERRDLTRGSRKRRRFDFASCINVLLSPKDRDRLAILRHIHGELRKGGRMILVVPSLESGLFAGFVWREWDLVVGHGEGRELEADGLPAGETEEAVGSGIISTGGAATKHFLKEELEVLLGRVGFGEIAIEKVEYGWSTEFEDAPATLGAPYPWDWVATGRKT